MISEFEYVQGKVWKCSNGSIHFHQMQIFVRDELHGYDTHPTPLTHTA